MTMEIRIMQIVDDGRDKLMREHANGQIDHYRNVCPRDRTTGHRMLPDRPINHPPAHIHKNAHIILLAQVDLLFMRLMA